MHEVYSSLESLGLSKATLGELFPAQLLDSCLSRWDLRSKGLLNCKNDLKPELTLISSSEDFKEIEPDVRLRVVL